MVVSSESWVQVGEESVLVAAANRHNGLGRGGLTEATKTSIRPSCQRKSQFPAPNTDAEQGMSLPQTAIAAGP